MQANTTQDGRIEASNDGGGSGNPGIRQQANNGGLLDDALLRLEQRLGRDVRKNQGAGIRTEEDLDRRNREDEEALEQLAKEQGKWVEEVDELLAGKFGAHITQGSEAFVYSKDNNSVIKSRSLVGYDTVFEALESIRIHNRLFPETAMTILAFGRSDGEFTAILEQPRIEGRFADNEETLRFVQDRFGAVKDDSVIGGTSYITSQYKLQDLKPKNVIANRSEGELKMFVVDGDFYGVGDMV